MASCEIYPHGAWASTLFVKLTYKTLRASRFHIKAFEKFPLCPVVPINSLATSKAIKNLTDPRTNFWHGFWSWCGRGLILKRFDATLILTRNIFDVRSPPPVFWRLTLWLIVLFRHQYSYVDADIFMLWPILYCGWYFLCCHRYFCIVANM